MLTREFAQAFSQDWIAGWNARDMDLILAHYTDDFEMSSPIIAQIAGEPSGRLKGKSKVEAYWRAALQKMPNLHFDYEQTLIGANSLTLIYRGHRGLSAEVFFFNDDLLVYKASANYL